jgi:hypothetical protein
VFISIKANPIAENLPKEWLSSYRFETEKGTTKLLERDNCAGN